MKNYLLITVASFLAIACNNDSDTEASLVALKNNYEINTSALYPEGIDYDTKNQRFVFGSAYKGAIYSMNTKGEVSLFATSNTLVSVTGVYTDETRNRLIVANADLGISEKSASSSSIGSIAKVIVYNLTTGALLKEIDLKPLTPTAGAFVNDIAVDGNGNIYITDSLSPVIYKVDIDYNASIFTTNNLFEPAPNDFGLNGIVFHPDGYLLVARTDNSKLFKVPVANPASVTEVAGITFNFPDGLELDKNNNLVIVENGLGLGKVYTFSSTDNWVNAVKVNETTIGKEEFPTTAALASNNAIYVINSKLGKLLSGDITQSLFTIQKIN